MKVAVLGASGSTGTLVIKKLLEKGHEVVAVSRSPLTPPPDNPRLQSHNGDQTNAGFIRDAIAGCDAVVSCLGQNRASKSLFAKRTSPPDILYRVAEATITAIGDGPQHYIYLSAFGVGADRKRHALFFRVVLRLSSIHDAYLDHDRAETAIRRSRTHWTIVRSPGLTEKQDEVPLVDKSKRWSSFETVSKRSLAAFMVSCVEVRRFLQQTITVGEASTKP